VSENKPLAYKKRPIARTTTAGCAGGNAIRLSLIVPALGEKIVASVDAID
jgi:hypothetical protein